MAVLASGRAVRGRMPLLAHLVELRRRLLVAALALLVGGVIGWFLTGDVLDALRAPLADVARTSHHLAALNFDTVSGAFDLRCRMAAYLGVAVSSPVWLYEVWAFIVPALDRRELTYAIGFLGTVLTVLVFTALVTPSADVVSMGLLALPMLGLYFGAAGIAAIHDRRTAKRAAIAAESLVEVGG